MTKNRLILLAAATIGLTAGVANAADLPYRAYKAAPPPPPVYNWTGVYIGVYGGVGAGSATGMPIGILQSPSNPTVVFGATDPATGTPIYSQNYNGWATSGNNTYSYSVGAIGASGNGNGAGTNASANVGVAGNSGVGIPNTINPVAQNYYCAGTGGANCNVSSPTINTSTGETGTFNAGNRTDAVLPNALQSSSQLAGLVGLEFGGRYQFQNTNFVLGGVADISFLSHGGAINYSSSGSFYNSMGASGYAQATGCTVTTNINVNGSTNNPAGCGVAEPLFAAGTVLTTNTGSSKLNLTATANPNWVGTVRGTVGYAFDRLLIFGSAGLAYSDAPLKVSGNYRETATSSCAGTAGSAPLGAGYFAANQNSATANGATAGFSAVNYTCGGAVNTNISQTVSTSINYSGNRGGGVLTGFAAGTGAAYALSDHVTLVAEGVYYNLGTARATVTSNNATSTQTTTTYTNGGPNVVPNGNTTVNGPTTVAANAQSFTLSKMIDGVMVKGGIQFKF